MQYRLVVLEGLHQGKEVPIRVPRFRIGRDPQCELRAHSPSVSAQHCVIEISAARARVRDLGGVNGTLVNHTLLCRGESAELRDGDRLQVAQLVFQFRTEDDQPAVEDQVAIWLGDADDAEVGETLRNTSMHVANATGPRIGQDGPSPALDELFSQKVWDEDLGVLILSLRPIERIDPVQSQLLRQFLMDWSARTKPCRILFDLSTVDILPSGAYALLYTLAQRCSRSGGVLRLCSVSEQIRSILRTLKFEEAIQCYDDRTTALAQL